MFNPKKSHLFIFLLIFLLIAPFSVLNVNAQFGTGYSGLVLSPDEGHGGESVQVSLDINTWVSVQGDRATPKLYNDKTFILVWDIGGWTNNEISALPDVIMKTSQWERIGSAKCDSNGHITGTATIPNRNEVGDHLLYAINEEGLLQGSTLDYWWGFFEILSGGSIATIKPTPTPSPTPNHPAQCQLTVKWMGDRGTVLIDGSKPSTNPFVATYDYGSKVNLEAVAANTNDVVTIREYNPAKAQYIREIFGPTATITIDIDKEVNVTFSDQPEGVPGFPVESIMIGLILALGLLYLTKKKSSINLRAPG
jgi:hypothetical protein